MDEARAQSMADSLIGKDIDGWHLTEIVGHGKSAVVLKAIREAEARAVKVFDPELIERFGEENQRKRIERELALTEQFHKIWSGYMTAGTGRTKVFTMSRWNSSMHPISPR